MARIPEAEIERLKSEVSVVRLYNADARSDYINEFSQPSAARNHGSRS
ncbi:hypothetical protein [Enterococcus faecium]